MSGSAKLCKHKAIEIHQKLWEVRLFELRAAELYREGHLPGFIHLSLGQEACAVGACLALEEKDFITSTHRGHGHCLAKGADPRFMMAELAGKHEGYSKGRGGSMHIADVSKGVLGANGIVGQSAPLACGAALTAQVKNTGQAALAFFGEGASGSGPVHEAMNIAAIWKLPVIFFCEVNRYAELSPYSVHVPIERLSERSKSYGFDGFTVDGSNVKAVYNAVSSARQKIRSGGGPVLIEAKTHRWHGHYEGDPMHYLDDKDRDSSQRMDPVVMFEAACALELGINTEELSKSKENAITLIDDAVSFALGLGAAPTSVISEDVYA